MVRNPLTGRNITMGDLQTALKNPGAVKAEMKNSIYGIYNAYSGLKYGEGINVINEDWDNLLILDAARYDLFPRTYGDRGNLEYRISKGCYTWEFMRENFQGGTYHDTVYVSANPQCVKFDPEIFYRLIYLEDEWDPDLHTVVPSDVNDAVRELFEDFSDKRLIVHYMQPHAPYFDEGAEALKSEVPEPIHGWHKYHLQAGKDEHLSGLTWNEAVNEEYLSWEQIRDLYCRHYELVLDYAVDLGEELPGKTVITSDHGELLGDRVTPFTPRESGHTVGINTPILKKVPWFVLDAVEERRSISSEDPSKMKVDIDQKVVKERLAALGYAE